MKVRSITARAGPYALLAGAALALTWPLWRAAGMPYNVDISGFFPLTVEAYEGRFWPLWNERGGMSAAQFLPALLVELPFLLLGHGLGWGMDAHIKVRILFGFALAGMAMYALARYHLERHYADRLAPWLRVALPLVPAILYMANPWSVHRAFHYFLWLGYAFAPLVLLAFLRLADAPSLRRALVLALVAALGSADPHNPPLFALVVAPFALARLVGMPRAKIGGLARALGVSAAAYVAVAAYWILPYAYNMVAVPGFGPSYVLSDEMLGVLSRSATLLDVLRLTHNYNPRAPLMPEGGSLLTAWNVASLAIPILAALGLLLARRRDAWCYGALGALAIFLGLGSTSGGLYHWALFEAPWGEGLSWLMRDPYRWGGIQALAYGALLAFALAEILALVDRAPGSLRLGLAPAPASFALACTLLFVGPAVAGYMGAVYSPVEVPSDYAEANAYLATTPETDGVVWMPRMLGSTTWGGDRTMEYFDATSSERSALGPFRPHTSLYFRFLDDAAKDGADVPALMARAGLSRIVFHDDRDPQRDASKVATLENAGLAREAHVGSTPVRAVDATSLAIANTPAAKYSVNGSRELAQTLTPSLATPISLMVKARAVDEPGALRLTIRDETGKLVATRNATAEAKEGEAVFGLRGLRLVPGRAYAIHLSAPTTPATGGARWDLSYYKVDTYPEGAMRANADATNASLWKPVEGDLAFELAATEEGFIDILRSPDPAPRIRGDAAIVASPGDLQILRALAALPANGTLATAPVVFSAANERARTALAEDAPWHWVARLDASPWETLVPFLPKETIVAPFGATTSADGKAGWARGTEEFAYYEWGWSSSLAALKQEAWDFDGDRGLVYTSAAASLAVPVPPSAEGTVVLARVYEHPQGGVLKVYAGDALVGELDTKSDATGFHWRSVGKLAGDASALRLAGDGALQGVNLLAVVPRDALDAARALRDARFADTPVTLVQQMETASEAGGRTLAYPRTGRFLEMDRNVTLGFDLPAPGPHSLWIRVANASNAPLARIDGKPIGALACVAECRTGAPWLAVPMGALEGGRHELTLSPASNASAMRPTIDLLAITSEPGGLAAASPPVDLTWTRVGAAEYRIELRTPGRVALSLAQPYDGGWTARLDDGSAANARILNGVDNVFLLSSDGNAYVTIEYAPHAWAEGGVGLAIAALAVLGAALAASVWRERAARRHAQEEAQ